MESNSKVKKLKVEENLSSEKERKVFNLDYVSLLPDIIETLRDPKGAPLRSIEKYLCARYCVDQKDLPMDKIKSALKQCVKSEILFAVSSQKWKLGPKFQTKKKPLERKSYVPIIMDENEKQLFYEQHGFPSDVFLEIFSHLDPIPDIIRMFRVSKGIARVAKSPRIWSNLDFSKFPHIPKADLERFIKSFGKILKSINVREVICFGDELLQILNENAPELESLSFDLPQKIIKRFPEDFDLIWPKLKKLHPHTEQYYSHITTQSNSKIPVIKKFPLLESFNGNINDNNFVHQLLQLPNLKEITLNIRGIQIQLTAKDFSENLKKICLSGDLSRIPPNKLPMVEHLELHHFSYAPLIPLEEILKENPNLKNFASSIPAKSIKVEHKSMEKLILWSPTNCVINCPSLNTLILWPSSEVKSKHQVEFISLPPLETLSLYQIPEYFSCDSLLYLKVYQFPENVSFPNLKILIVPFETEIVKFHNNSTIKKHPIIDLLNFPKIEKLTLFSEYFESLTLDSQTLKEFDFNNPCPKLIEFKNLPSLSKCHIQSEILSNPITDQTHFPYLKHLFFDRLSMSDLCFILSHSPKIETLYLTRPSLESPKTSTELYFEDLKELTLESCFEMSEEFFSFILKISPNIRTLNLREIDKLDQYIGLIANKIPKGIQKMSFLDSQIGDKEFVLYSDKLFSSIKDLTIGSSQPQLISERQYQITNKTIFSLSLNAPNLEILELHRTLATDHSIPSLVANKLKSFFSYANGHISKNQCLNLYDDFGIFVIRKTSEDLKQNSWDCDKKTNCIASFLGPEWSFQYSKIR